MTPGSIVEVQQLEQLLEKAMDKKKTGPEDKKIIIC